MNGRDAIPSARYATVAIVLHWTIAGLIVANLVLGWRMGFLKGMSQFATFQLHKSIGMTVLALSVARLAWRLVNPPPPLPPGTPPWERRAAGVVHALLYGMMIAMPLTGWIIVSVSPWNIPTLLWSAIPLPHIDALHALPAAPKASVEAGAGAVHLSLALGGAALILLHAGAALLHRFVRRDGVLGRMAPFPPIVRNQGKP